MTTPVGQERSDTALWAAHVAGDPTAFDAVSYTHLDVYKRQSPTCPWSPLRPAVRPRVTAGPTRWSGPHRPPPPLSSLTVATPRSRTREITPRSSRPTTWAARATRRRKRTSRRGRTGRRGRTDRTDPKTRRRPGRTRPPDRTARATPKAKPSRASEDGHVSSPHRVRTRVRATFRAPPRPCSPMARAAPTPMARAPPTPMARDRRTTTSRTTGRRSPPVKLSLIHI